VRRKDKVISKNQSLLIQNRSILFLFHAHLRSCAAGPSVNGYAGERCSHEWSKKKSCLDVKTDSAFSKAACKVGMNVDWLDKFHNIRQKLSLWMELKVSKIEEVDKPLPWSIVCVQPPIFLGERTAEHRLPLSDILVVQEKLGRIWRHIPFSSHRGPPLTTCQ